MRQDETEVALRLLREAMGEVEGGDITEAMISIATVQRLIEIAERPPKVEIYKSTCSVCGNPFEVEHPAGTHVAPGLMGKASGVECRFKDWTLEGTTLDWCTPCLRDSLRQLAASDPERLVVQ